MAPQNGGGGGHGGKDDYKDAKDFLDKIGQQVHDEIVKKDAKTYKEALTGQLSFASIFGEETVSSLDPCDLESEYTKLIEANIKRHPCDKRSPVRFSDEYGGQCTFNRIKDNETHDNKCGACAPYRRLHLCDYNLEKMGTTKSKARHNLLAEVCLAAKYE
ncbi:hypothetical protein PFMC_00856, partial [Plasmodium falciparum CAMP/Malaysia]